MRSGDSIGRKQSNKIIFQDDFHMSNLHCKINQIQEIFLFEDIASTNGSWQRLSDENKESQQVVLKEGMVFKIGNSAMYEVERIEGVGQSRRDLLDPQTIDDIGNPQRGQNSSNNLCCICWSADRDILLQPCRHIVSCAKCIKG